MTDTIYIRKTYKIVYIMDAYTYNNSIRHEKER